MSQLGDLGSGAGKGGGKVKWLEHLKLTLEFKKNI